MTNQKSLASASGLVLTVAAVVVWLLALHTASIYSFTTGFFLTRYEVKNFSDSHQPEHAAQFQKAVIVVIDALRFDFALHNFSLDQPYPTPFTNRLPVIFETLRDDPHRSFLFKFVADPPTTTMQRLKGLTTGGMPTFIDAIDNFNSDAIREDSWVRQLSQMGKKVVFMGDDTWISLFPDSFTRSYPFPSFDVKDLHTVDNGVIVNLIPEIRKRNGDWDVIIGHFLGVDHVGHRLGSEHPEMASKLAQMDQVLRDLKESLDEDTILMVFGDHGMTPDGNHGGSTDLEVDSALFVYSKRKINHSPAKAPSVDTIPSVYQIDLVPSICSLLGVPIPFGNLGFIIPELEASRSRSDLEQADIKSLERYALLASENAKQIWRYLETYSASTRQFPSEDYIEVEKLYSTAREAFQAAVESKNEAKLLSAIEAFLQFHTVAISMCRRLWTTFDTAAMWIGLLGAFAASGSALVAALSTLDQLSSKRLILLSLIGALTGGSIGAAVLGWTRTALPSIVGLAAIGSAFFFSVISGLTKPVIMGALQLLFPATFASASNTSATTTDEELTIKPRARASSTESGDFAPYKAPVSEYGWLYGLVALLCLFMRCAGLWSNSYIESEDQVSYFLLATLAATFGISSFGSQATRHTIQRSLVLFLALKLSGFVTGGKHESFLSGTHPVSIFMQTFVPVLALPPAALSLSEIYESYASRSSPKRSSYWIRMWLHVCVAAVPTFWTAQWFGWLESFWGFRILLPQFVFIGSTVALALRFAFQSTQRLDFVFGWIAALSFPPLALILGPPSPASLLSLFVAAHCILDLSAEIERRSASSKSAFGFTLAVFWHLLSTRWFYVTGHSQQFNALQFSAPFVGFDKFNFVLGAIVMVVNTFASQMLCGFFVPFLAFWEGRPTLLAAKRVAASAKLNLGDATRRHDDVLRRVPRPLETLARRTLFYIFVTSFIFVNTVGLTFMMRRHLMVWRVFAPKFVFEAGSLIVTNIAVLIGMIVTWRHTP